jgi:hypothetical protein
MRTFDKNIAAIFSHQGKEFSCHSLGDAAIPTFVLVELYVAEKDRET